jgi:hypothetical protein
MKNFIHIDEEQAELLTISATALASALDARSRRVDPDGVIAKSAKLQSIKMQNVLNQLSLPAPYTWRDMPAENKAEVARLTAILNGPKTDAEKDAAWTALAAYVLRRAPADLPPFDGPYIEVETV